MRLERFKRISAEAAKGASLALGRLVGQPVFVEIADVELIRIPESNPGMDREELVLGIYIPIGVPPAGAALLCFPRAEAEAIAEKLTAEIARTRSETRLMEDSALKEVGNIICGNYVAVLANDMRTKIVPGPPHLARGMFGSIYGQVIAKLALEVNTMVLVRVKIALVGQTLAARLLLLFRAEQLVEADGGA